MATLAMSTTSGSSRPTSSVSSSSDAPLAVQRIAGVDRAATAVAVARSLDRSLELRGSDIAIANGQRFADTLVAASSGLPILLTGLDRLPPATRTFLEDGRAGRAAAARALVYGGTAVVSDEVVAELQSLGFTVTRIGGADRYATAAMGLPSNCCTRVGIATGEDFPDALVAGMLGPVLLTRRDALPASTAASLDTTPPDTAVVIGGTEAVGGAVVDDVRGRGIDVTRIAGADRLETAVAVAREWSATVGRRARDNAVVLVRGDDFPDSLAASGIASRVFVPILLTRSPDVLGRPTADYLAEIGNCGLDIRVVGGPAAVSDAVVATAQAAATPSGGCDATQVAGPRLVGARTEPATDPTQAELVLEWDEPVFCWDNDLAPAVFAVRRADGTTTTMADDNWDCNLGPSGAETTMRVTFDGVLTGGSVTYQDITTPAAVVRDRDLNRADPPIQQVAID